MRLYVIGPVSGVPDLNRRSFEGARRELEGAGYEVVIPHDVVPPDTTWDLAMRLSIAEMMCCDAVAMLDGILRSDGAMIERDLCRRIGIDCLTVAMWCDRPLMTRGL